MHANAATSKGAPAREPLLLCPIFAFRRDETLRPPLIHQVTPVDSRIRNREDTPLSRYEDACPFEARARASHCHSCSSSSNNVPPCVAAYLGGPRLLPAANVIPLFRVEVLSARKAA